MMGLELRIFEETLTITMRHSLCVKSIVLFNGDSAVLTLVYIHAIFLIGLVEHEM